MLTNTTLEGFLTTWDLVFRNVYDHQNPSLLWELKNKVVYTYDVRAYTQEVFELVGLQSHWYVTERHDSSSFILDGNEPFTRPAYDISIFCEVFREQLCALLETPEMFYNMELDFRFDRVTQDTSYWREAPLAYRKASVCEPDSSNQKWYYELAVANREYIVALTQANKTHAARILARGEGLLPARLVRNLIRSYFDILRKPWDIERSRLHAEYSSHENADAHSKGYIATQWFIDGDYLVGHYAQSSYDPTCVYALGVRNNRKHLKAMQKSINEAFELLDTGNFGTLRSMLSRPPSAKLFKQILWFLQNTPDKDQVWNVFVPYVEGHFRQWPVVYQLMDGLTKYDADLCARFVRVWELKNTRMYQAFAAGTLPSLPEYVRFGSSSCARNFLPKEGVQDLTPYSNLKGCYRGSPGHLDAQFIGVLGRLPNFRSIHHVQHVQHVQHIRDDNEYRGALGVKEELEAVLGAARVDTSSSFKDHVTLTCSGG